MMTNFSQDLRFALRALKKSPSFAVLAVVTLALGIAVNATIFSAINGFLLRPMPASHPEELAVLRLQQSGDKTLQNFSFPDYLELRESNKTFSDIAGYRITLGSLLADNRGDHSIITRVTGNFFSLLGIQPAQGRLILPTEGQVPGADPVIVLGYSYWQKRFGGDPGVVGRRVELNNHPLTIVGVAQKGFNGAYPILDSDLYVPLSVDISSGPGAKPALLWTDRTDRSVSLLARLKPGTKIQPAEAAMSVIAQRIASEHPQTEKGISIRVFPESQARPDPDPENSLANVAVAFMLLAGLVLLVACFNVSNVLLVRATVRQREMAIRAALGAGRGRLVRQYVTESLVLALLGGAGGMLLAYWATRYLSSLPLGTDLPLRLNFLPDLRVYFFALGAVILTGLMVSVLPAMRVARRDINLLLHETGRGSSAGRRRQLTRSALVIAQVAGSLVLLIVAGLFVRSLGKAQQVYLGFDPHNVLNVSLDVGQLGYQETLGRTFFRDLETRLRALPGVVSVGQAFSVPMGVISSGATVHVEGHTLAAGEQPPNMQNNPVSTGYFDALRIPIHRGRAFTDSDTEKSTQVAVVNETMAKQLWPNQDALGKRFSTTGASGPFIQVVGVVQDGRYKSIVEQPEPHFYLPVNQAYVPLRTIHIRTSVRPETLATQVQTVVQELAPGLDISHVETMEHALEGINGFLFFRLGAQLTATMGLLGLVLAVVGVYSVASYAAAQRTHEIGIRMAIGATPREILSMMLRQGSWTVGVGALAGLAIAYAGTRLLADLFYGVKPGDPISHIAGAGLLLGVALVACWVPARRATQVSPLVALRID
jgi:putative ABC transport system permease protein